MLVFDLQLGLMLTRRTTSELIVSSWKHYDVYLRMKVIFVNEGDTHWFDDENIDVQFSSLIKVSSNDNPMSD